MLEDDDNKVESEVEDDYDSSMTTEIKQTNNLIGNQCNDAINLIDNLLS